MQTSHESNQELADVAATLADHLGWHIRHNCSSWLKFSGAHRYLVLDGRTGAQHESIRSRACREYWETPHSKYWTPSIRGERGCLTEMIEWLKMRPMPRKEKV